MDIHDKLLTVCASGFGASSVVLAAVGAHAIHGSLVLNQQLATYAKAVNYSTTGAFMIIALVVLRYVVQKTFFVVSGYLFAVGTLLFSGSLYVSIFFHYHPIVAVTPWGGMILICAWLSIGVFAVSKFSSVKR